MTNSLAPGVRSEIPEVRSQVNTLGFEFWLKNNAEPRLQLKEKVYLESHKGRKKVEPVEMHGLRK